MTDKELLRIVAGFRKGIVGKKNPAGMCWKVCFPLQTFISCSGISCKSIEVGILKNAEMHAHWCLELSDGRILDPTASQFTDPNGKEMPVIYLGERPTWYKEFRFEKTNSQHDR